MGNKTCGECRFYNSDHNLCLHWKYEDINNNSPICNYFKPPTNSDVIRQMSNEKLVQFKGARHCTFCAYCDQKIDKCNRPIGGTCAEGILEWLNAPAEREGENK